MYPLLALFSLSLFGGSTSEVTPHEEYALSSAYYVISDEDIDKSRKYYFIHNTLSSSYPPYGNVENFGRLFDSDTLSFDDLYDYLTERDYTNPLYGRALEYRQSNVVWDLCFNSKKKEVSLTNEQMEQMIEMFKRVKTFEQNHPNPYNTQYSLEESIDLCLAELEK